MSNVIAKQNQVWTIDWNLNYGIFLKKEEAEKMANKLRKKEQKELKAFLKTKESKTNEMILSRFAVKRVQCVAGSH